MCSSGDSTVKSTEQAQAAMTSTLSASFKTAFAAKQDTLNRVNAKLTDMMNNPQGFDPKTLALMKTNASDTVARNTNAAQVGANAYLATHGGAELGSGVAAQIKGGIGAAGAMEDARETSGIDIQSGLLQNDNYWKAINGLTNVANSENPEGLASAEVGSADATGNLSKAYLASKQADWQNAFGVVKGIAGLGSAVAGMAMGAPSFGGSSGSNPNSPSGIGVGGDSTGWYD
jgi:hypothetical protein